jgi:hypothetical protein
LLPWETLDVDVERVSATFPCHRSGGHACTVTLLPPGEPDPQALRAAAAGSAPPGVETAGARSIRLSVDGPVKTTHGIIAPERLAALADALRAGNGNALVHSDREYAPSYCYQCATHYCCTCWEVWVEYDDGFYDCTRGRCPEGHERSLAMHRRRVISAPR